MTKRNNNNNQDNRLPKQLNLLAGDAEVHIIKAHVQRRPEPLESFNENSRKNQSNDQIESEPLTFLRPLQLVHGDLRTIILKLLVLTLNIRTVEESLN